MSGDFLGLGAMAPKATASQLTPPAPPVQAKDPDKALANTALGVLRLNNWNCKEDDDYRSFVLTINIRSASQGVIGTEHYRITAENGLLILEVPVLDLPSPAPNAAMLLMVIAELNTFSVGAALLLTTEGVVMRHPMIPHAQQDGYFNVKMLQQCLRQIEHDRRRARTILQPIVESKPYDPFAAEAAYKNPVAPAPIAAMTPKELIDLAMEAGFSVHSDSRFISISRAPAKPELSKVHLLTTQGHLRGIVNVGVTTTARYVISRCPATVRHGLEGTADWPSGKMEQLYWVLNTLNHTSGLLRFVAMDKKIAAIAIHFPTDYAMDANQFKVFANTLIDCAEAGGTS